MVDVGLAYENGQGGLAKDRARAIKLYRRAHHVDLIMVVLDCSVGS